jgi:hypothetical protein
MAHVRASLQSLHMSMLANSTSNSTGGNATNTAEAISVPAEVEEPFDLSAWLRSKPDGTWKSFTDSHPEPTPFDLSAWLDSQPKYDLNAYLNNQPQPAPPPSP